MTVYYKYTVNATGVDMKPLYLNEVDIIGNRNYSPINFE